MLAPYLSTPVVNVKGSTMHSIVIFVAQEETLELSLSFQGANKSSRPTQPHLPTPLKFNNLLLFFSKYDNSIVLYFATGFTMGFPLHYEGPSFRVILTTYCRPWKILPLWMLNRLRSLMLIGLPILFLHHHFRCFLYPQESEEEFCLIQHL